MFFSYFIHSLRRFCPRNDQGISLQQYRRRIWLTALLFCVLFWLVTGVVIHRLFFC